MKYAATTEVSVRQSRMEIEELIAKSGGQKFGTATEPGRAIVVFEMADRRISFELKLPMLSDFKTVKRAGAYYATTRSDADANKHWEQSCRTKWRALLLTIKAKLVSVDSQIETLEEAFLAHIVVPTEDGSARMGTLAIAAIRQAYLGKPMPPLLGVGS